MRCFLAICVCTGVPLVAACADGPAAPEAPLPSASVVKEIVTFPKPGTTTFQATTILADCGASCVIHIGETRFVGLRVDGTLAAGAAADIRGAGHVRVVVGGSDTIPAPPAPRRSFMAASKGAAAEFDALLAAAGVVPSDTIPSPPSPFIVTASSALYVMSVDDLVAKGVLPRDGGGEVDFRLVWTEASRLGSTTWEVAGRLPPSDTIPSPPLPTK